MSVEINDIEKNKEEVKDIIKQIIDKGANYAIKSIPINEHVKEILRDVKKSLEEDEFNQVLKIAITSSINEGLEIIGMKKSDLKKIDKMVDVAFKGGLQTSINLGIDIISASKRVGNLFGKYIDDFYKSVKGFISSPVFENKVNNNIAKCINKVNKFKTLCKNWYDAYDKLDMDKINTLASQMKKQKYTIAFDNDCLNQNNIIQNITEIVKVKNDKLTKNQLDIVKEL